MEYQIFVVGTVNGRREATCWAGQTWSVGPAKAYFRPAEHSVESITAQDDDNFGCQHLLILLFFLLGLNFLLPCVSEDLWRLLGFAGERHCPL
jgi:hypothetical protein